MADPAGTTAIQSEEIQSKEIEISIEPSSSSAEYVEVLEQLGLKLGDDGYVKWKGDCTAHPRNWRASRKAFDTGLILMLDLFTYLLPSRFHHQFTDRLWIGQRLALQEYVNLSFGSHLSVPSFWLTNKWHSPQ